MTRTTPQQLKKSSKPFLETADAANEESSDLCGKNSNLSAAKTLKNDEFYTLWADVEKEINAYLEFDPELFRDKVVLLPCDDPEWSNFTKYFALHFVEFGIKRLISTSYAPDSKNVANSHQPTLFEAENPQFDPVKTRANGRVFVLEAVDLNGDGVVDLDDLQWRYLEGDGDFRSAEVTALRDGADIVVTNPPFSLFREFMAWLVDGGKKFAVIGNQNAVITKELFPLFKSNLLWLGASSPKEFRDGDHSDLAPLKSFGNIRWFTNIEHGRRHQPLQLMSEADNIKHSKHKKVRGVGYSKYENYSAIEVPFVDAIPSDHLGIMGVPISFLDKYDPEQFEIVWQASGNTRVSAPASVLKTLGYTKTKVDRGGCGVVAGARVFSRILIRRKTAA